jgi:hypothetical protein
MFLFSWWKILLTKYQCRLFSQQGFNLLFENHKTSTVEATWINVYSSKDYYKVEIVQAVLTDNGINSVIIKKQDSSYLFGYIELHVHPDDSIRAIQLIESEQL